MKPPIEKIIGRDFNRQRGMALVFALVVLLILTILGMSNLRTSSLEQMMSGNTQEQTRAFEAADSGASKVIYTLTQTATANSNVDPTAFTQGSPYTYATPSTIIGESSTAKAIVTSTTTIQTGVPAPRSSKPSGSAVCAAFQDQTITGITSNSVAQETIHVGYVTGAPCSATP